MLVSAVFGGHGAFGVQAPCGEGQRYLCLVCVQVLVGVGFFIRQMVYSEHRIKY